MKVSANDLFDVVRQIVKEEVKKIVPGLIREHLTENYLRKMVAESTINRAGPFVNTEQEEIPKLKKSIDKGIYADVEPFEEKKDDMNELLSRKNPMSFVYEGINTSEEKKHEVDVGKLNVDFSKMNSLLEQVEKNPKREIQVSMDSKMRELEMKRRLLEVPAGAR